MNCYCGHPKERHNHGEDEMGDEVRYGGNCKHCLCSEYGPKPKALEEVLLGVDSGPEGTCKLYGYRKDGVVHVTREKYSKPQEALEEKLAECDCNGMHEGNCPDPRVAKPQDEPKECCEKCVNRYDPSPGDTCWRRYKCPCHQKETEPKEDPVTESDKKAVEEFRNKYGGYLALSDDAFQRAFENFHLMPSLEAFILKTRQEAREEVMSLPS